MPRPAQPTIRPSKAKTERFKKTIWSYYRLHRRSFPWREHIDPYHVVVSEIMLQQTQAPRVVSKFNSFLKNFPDFSALADAPLSEVLKEWQGLGYNRRAVSLKKLAAIIVDTHRGRLPHNKPELVELPGIGPHTAGSILAFAFNIAEPFIETNIRTVYIHFFFGRSETKTNILDKEILDLVKKTIDEKNPREWFFALMDYGVYLKQKARQERQQDPAQRSRHYKKQSSFKGSNRQLRAELLREILKKPQSEGEVIRRHLDLDRKNPHRTGENIMKNLKALEREGFIEMRAEKDDKKYFIKK